MRGIALAIALVGCGRLGFDAPAASDGGSDGTGLDDAGQSIYRAAVMADSPVSYWRLGDSDAVARNEVPGGPHATFSGTLMRGVPGAVNDDTASAWDGESTRLESDEDFPFIGNAPYTVELWAKAAASADSRWIIHRRSDADPEQGWSIYHGDDVCIHARKSDDIEVAYAGAGERLPPGEWSYIVVTFDGEGAKFYFNGEERLNGQSTAAIGPGAGRLTIGDRVEGQFFKFQGSLDEIALYDHVLPHARIAAHYAASGR